MSADDMEAMLMIPVPRNPAEDDDHVVHWEHTTQAQDRALQRLGCKLSHHHNTWLDCAWSAFMTDTVIYRAGGMAYVVMPDGDYIERRDDREGNA